ncbi:MAG: ligase-associated DNA damage response DEXH box helicase, partial [Saprospiraceae bacterium]|nr:ligase-associated DNA damage response DEXH box helicase [Saprospiraceae bacterium]
MRQFDPTLIETGQAWFSAQGWDPFPFQLKAWRAYLSGKSGMVCAPTGYGKTYSLCVPALLDGIRNGESGGLRILWITPIRALAKEIRISWQRAIDSFASDWRVDLRTGDTTSTERAKQLRSSPEVLITTPESLQLLLATKGYARFFHRLDAIIADEWHELVGSKRGVLMELALSRLKTLRPALRIWAISATLGNVEEAMQMLFGADYRPPRQVVIQSKARKQIEVIPVLPEDIETYPWAGYFGTRMLDKVLPIIHDSQSTIIFTNTRSMCERWYQKLLEADDSLAGVTAMHHGSISREIRDWVEESLYQGKLKAVVSTSSLDLGVDFRPVESVVQIGSPKGVARCIQRAGRSGHQPGAVSRIYFVPTHALELIEAAGLRKAIKEGLLEVRSPHVRSFDVLVQYLVTLAVSDGFRPEEIYPEVKGTFCYASIEPSEWQWILNFIVHGGSSLQAYDEFKKVVVQDGLYQVQDRRIALRHRLGIGTIVGALSMQIKYLSGKRLGTIEETFVMRLNPGDVFWFAGCSLEFVRIKDNVAFVRRSKKKTGNVPSWQGGRMPLSSQLSQMLRAKVVEFHGKRLRDRELKELKPLLDLQERYSRVPRKNEFLIELYQSGDGHHLLMYPFEGRFVHEGMGALIGHRIARIKP